MVLKCKMCGGTVEFEKGESVGICDSCGTKQTIPSISDEKKANLYNRANHFRRNNEYDKAMEIYNQILNEGDDDAETYWSIVLCRYGIEYVKDPRTKEMIPTINRAQFTSIFDDDDYKLAIEKADEEQKKIYKEEATKINNIQKGFLAISQNEEPYDVFICYKETDENGKRTQESVLANDLYFQLTEEGFKVFFARITLEDKLGSQYEPYIFAALNSAKVMVVIGTKPENFNAVWVKNEWSRFLPLVKESRGKKILIPAYRDMDPYDLPDEFSHLQAQDMSKLGFMQDLLRGIKKLINGTETKKESENVETSSNNNSVKPLLKRAYMFLEDRDVNNANTYFNNVLDIDPENADAYLGKLMVETKHFTKDEMLNDNNFQINGTNTNYKRFSSLVANSPDKELHKIYKHINSCIKFNELNETYLKVVDFGSGGAEEVRLKKCEQLIEEYNKIVDFPGVKEKIDGCKKCIEEIKPIIEIKNKEAEERERKKEEQAIKAQKVKSLLWKFKIPIVILFIVLVSLFVVNIKRSIAMKEDLMNYTPMDKLIWFSANPYNGKCAIYDFEFFDDGYNNNGNSRLFVQLYFSNEKGENDYTIFEIDGISKIIEKRLKLFNSNYKIIEITDISASSNYLYRHVVVSCKTNIPYEEAKKIKKKYQKN